jgi:hypothetical protein
MLLPATIKVGGFQWTIEESKDVTHEGSVFGTTHHHTQKLIIEPDISVQKKNQTILHEMMHAIWWQSGLDRMFGDLKTDRENEERIIHALSMGLYQVLTDNNIDLKN